MSNKDSASSGKKKAKKSGIKVFGSYFIGAIVIIAGFVITFQFVEPAPPKQITMVTGGTKGAYFHYGKQFREYLQKRGIKVTVVNTAGSVENVKKLTAKEPPVDIGFVQGGISTGNKDIIALGSVYYEPLWVFYRGDSTITHITQLKDKKIAIGAEGSGTQALARIVLNKNGITNSANLKPITGKQAAAELKAGNIDVMFMVASPKSKLVQELLADEQTKIMSFQRAESYARFYPYLTVVTLPEGVVDFQKNVPKEKVTLLATTANLVAKKDIHPAIVSVLMQAAVHVHSKQGIFEKHGQFPTPKLVSFELDKEAKRFYKHGVPFLQRFLPFRLASLIDRLKIMLLPLIGLMLPIFKILPPLYRWGVRRKIYRWYSELREVDPELGEVASEDIQKHLEHLSRIESDVTRLSVPLSYTDEVYNLRLHINMVKNSLRNKAKGLVDAPVTALQ
jgi:TRAP transporter TAXI family solute receptor